MNKNNTTQNLYIGLSYQEIIRKYDEIVKQEEEIKIKKRMLSELKKRKYSEATKREQIRLQKKKWKEEEIRDENGRLIVRFAKP